MAKLYRYDGEVGGRIARAQPGKLMQINNPDQVSWVQFPSIVCYAGIRIVQLVHRSVEPVAPEQSRYSCLNLKVDDKSITSIITTPAFRLSSRAEVKSLLAK